MTDQTRQDSPGDASHGGGNAPNRPPTADDARDQDQQKNPDASTTQRPNDTPPASAPTGN